MGFIDSLENMLFGDPVYDERGQVVKRNFGLMNAAMIVLLVVLGIGLFKGFPNMKPKSGKKKMKGGKWLKYKDIKYDPNEEFKWFYEVGTLTKPGAAFMFVLFCALVGLAIFVIKHT